MKSMRAKTNGNGAERPDVSQTTADQRITVRFPCDLKTACGVPFGGRSGQAWKGTLRDVSLGGVGLVLGRWFGRGTMLEIQVTTDGEEVAARLLVQVVHARLTAEGLWHVGCKMAHPVTEAELEGLFRAPAEGDGV